MCQKGFVEYHSIHYPDMQVTDKIKLVYQAILGPHHLLDEKSIPKIKENILTELNEQSNHQENLYEWIGPNYVRVNIKKYYEIYNNIDKLVLDFYNSNTKVELDKDMLKKMMMKYIDSSNLVNYNFEPVSHSMLYKERYQPHYRLLNSKYIDLDMKVKQFDNYISNLPSKSIVALEGRCGSGKTTISNILENKYTVIHIDDFFLSEKQKETYGNRLNSNINYDLVNNNLEKVINALKNNLPIVSIKCFDCHSQNYYEKELALKDKIIVEGVCASSPKLSKHIDKIAYLFVDKATQTKRIEQRELKDRFFNEWIPLEEKYFTRFDIFRHCDVII